MGASSAWLSAAPTSASTTPTRTTRARTSSRTDAPTPRAPRVWLACAALALCAAPARARSAFDRAHTPAAPPPTRLRGGWADGGAREPAAVERDAPADDAIEVEEFDVVVIGGGSGGLACAQEAAKHGKSVAVCDFVPPSPAGSSWGLGGTCVNVGCIPKKLMHQAALLGQALADAPSYGWELRGPAPRHSWPRLVDAVQSHIKGLNFGYRAALLSADVEYVNGFAAFEDARTVRATMADGSVRRLRAAHYVLATGGRPRYLDAIPGGRELVVSSDDLFGLRAPPGKTLCIGGGYVALECAGLLAGLGMEAHVLVRSRPLRGFDRQMSELVVAHMEDAHAVRFIRAALPTRIERVEGGRLRVTWRLVREPAAGPVGSSPDARADTAAAAGRADADADADAAAADGAAAAAAAADADAEAEEEEEESEEYDTVLVAIGRDAQTAGLRLERAGVAVDPTSGKIVAVDGAEQTSAPHVHAIGDVLAGKPELTPVAIRAGRLLARRLCAGGSERMDYESVPTAVFTPLEYACVGLSEDDARAALGDARVEVYHAHFTPLEWALPHRPENACYAKLVCDAARDERVLGVHVCGPGAGEMVQGFALALKLGCTRTDLEATVAIHPTCAEELVSLGITKRSGADARKRGC